MTASPPPDSRLALIFDLDGVIVHSTPMHNRSWREYLDRHGIESGDIERRMFGLRNDEIVRDLFGAHLTPDEVHSHGAGKEKLYREMMRPVLEQYLIPGVRDFLESQPHAKALASNAEAPNMCCLVDTRFPRARAPALAGGAARGLTQPRPTLARP